MKIIERTRELGELLQADERYKNYHESKIKNDNDTVLQEMIGEFNLKRMNLNSEMSKTDKDTARIERLNDEITSLYGNIMANENMAAFSNAKDAFDTLLNQINTIITASANGENPKTCPAEIESCGGSCSSCSGCH